MSRLYLFIMSSQIVFTDDEQAAAIIGGIVFGVLVIEILSLVLFPVAASAVTVRCLMDMVTR